MIWLGDFNKHHPLWDAPEDTHLFTPVNLNSASILLMLLEDHNIEMALPAGIPTIKVFCTGHYSHPDNVFGSADLLSSFTECNTYPHLKPACTDHLPVHGVINITPERTTPPPFHNWQAVDWDEYRTKLTLNVQKLSDPHPLADKDDFNLIFSMLMTAIQNVTEHSTPRTKPSLYTK